MYQTRSNDERDDVQNSKGQSSTSDTELVTLILCVHLQTVLIVELFSDAVEHMCEVSTFKNLQLQNQLY